MGIQGLLPALKPILEDGHIKDFKRKHVGVDTSSWLHKGAFACAYELAMGIVRPFPPNQLRCSCVMSWSVMQPTDKYIKYCLGRCKMMRAHGVIPVMVFDGCPMPAKRGTNDERARTRKAHVAQGMSLVQQGQRAAATKYFQGGISVTVEMTRHLQQALQAEGIEFIVAPYEADAQLAYMSLCGLIDCIVTEDSDLICYGAKRILFKMDHVGQGELYVDGNIGCVKNPDLANFTHTMLQYMCILAGCDFLPQIHGMGIKKAAAIVKTYRTMDKVFTACSTNPSFEIPGDYEDRFWLAVATFNHARVFNPRTQSACFLKDPPAAWLADPVLQQWLGPEKPRIQSQLLATGKLNPHTLEPYEEDRQSTVQRHPNRSRNVVERPNSSITAYVVGRRDVAGNCHTVRPGASPGRRPRRSRPVTPATSPGKSARSAEKTANPFVQFEETQPKSPAAEEKSRFFKTASDSPVQPTILCPESPVDEEQKPESTRRYSARNHASVLHEKSSTYRENARGVGKRRRVDLNRAPLDALDLDAFVYRPPVASGLDVGKGTAEAAGASRRQHDCQLPVDQEPRHHIQLDQFRCSNLSKATTLFPLARCSEADPIIDDEKYRPEKRQVAWRSADSDGSYSRQFAITARDVRRVSADSIESDDECLPKVVVDSGRSPEFL